MSEPARCPVLVLDPDPAVRRVVGLVLEGAGFACRACSSIEEARDVLAAFHPRLVLADERLVGDEAADLLEHLPAPHGSRPLMALMSAYPRWRRGSEDYFLRKPLEFDLLLQLLEGIAEDPGR